MIGGQGTAVRTTVQLDSSTVTAIGGLPHRDAVEAARVSLTQMDVPAIPSLPRRSPAEGSVAQAMVGMRGITVGQYGSISIDPIRVDPLAPISTDLQHDAFLGFRTFLAEAPRLRPGLEVVKWQFVGPVSFGLALVRAGLPASLAFESAMRCVRARLQHLVDEVAAALPDAGQVVVLEEPALADLMDPGFALAPDVAIDLVSGALSAIESRALVGLHICGVADLPSQIDAGPGLISVPVHRSVLDAVGHLVRFMERGGRIAWGAVPTSGPIAASAERAWHNLNDLWCQMAERGADLDLVRRQALITPSCGLAAHSAGVAERVLCVAAEVGRRARHGGGGSHWRPGA
ncbi:MAG: hypothetical protein RJB61_201 [Actinomycetota bacterium]